jgi:hypothetical protein
MADPDKDRVLKKTITIKRRTLNPYEKKFRRQGEYQYDLPVYIQYEYIKVYIYN